jgi:tripartite-type tricarboxylate transporter receptor subunit TctC
MNNNFDRRKALILGGSALAAAAVSGPSLAQSLPTGTIRILVGFPAGGGSDVMARLIAEKLKERTGANIIIDNRPGNSGNLACEMLKNAPADGSVLMFGTSATTVAQRVTRKQLQYDVEKDLVAIALAGTVSVAYVVSATIGVRTLPEYIEWLKKNPRKQNFGTTAMGSMTHFFGVLMGQSIGVPLEPVAYKGAAPLISDLSAGHASAGCGGVSDFLTHHRGDKMRIIAISAPKRVNAAPDLPTIAELGHPKLSYEGFYGFYGPSRMSAGLVAAWNKELRTVLDSPDMRQRLLGVGLEAESSTPTELFNRQSNLITYMTAMMKAAGVEPE